MGTNFLITSNLLIIIQQDPPEFAISLRKKKKNLSHTENLILDKLFCWGVCPLLLKVTGHNQDSLVLRRKQFMAFIKLYFLKYCFNIFYLTWRNISWNNENCHSISRAVLMIWYSLCQFEKKKNLWGSNRNWAAGMTRACVNLLHNGFSWKWPSCLVVSLTSWKFNHYIHRECNCGFNTLK